MHMVASFPKSGEFHKGRVDRNLLTVGPWNWRLALNNGYRAGSADGASTGFCARARVDEQHRTKCTVTAGPLNKKAIGLPSCRGFLTIQFSNDGPSYAANRCKQASRP